MIHNAYWLLELNVFCYESQTNLKDLWMWLMSSPVFSSKLFWWMHWEMEDLNTGDKLKEQTTWSLLLRCLAARETVLMFLGIDSASLCSCTAGLIADVPKDIPISCVLIMEVKSNILYFSPVACFQLGWSHCCMIYIISMIIKHCVSKWYDIHLQRNL